MYRHIHGKMYRNIHTHVCRYTTRTSACTRHTCTYPSTHTDRHKHRQTDTYPFAYKRMHVHTEHTHILS
jgi:hypothetical protein